MQPSNGVPRTESATLRIAVGIATVGRSSLLRVTLDEVMLQCRAADRIVVCAPTPADVEGCAVEGVEILHGPRGLTRQRNAILRYVKDCDVLVFFDDDFLPESSYLGVVEQVFVRNRDVTMMTGLVLADGIVGPGLSPEEARAALRGDVGEIDGIAINLRDVGSSYGCNMAVRLAAVRASGTFFDERLPLYGWLEDVDFSRQMVRSGRIVKASAARGVHLGIKQDRQSGRRLGYSQVANPIYLMRKGTCPWRVALALMGRSITANCIRALRPEPYIDRSGRAAGNAAALRDLIAGKLDPERILEMG